MRQSIHNLIEAVRALKLSVSGDKKARHLAIGVSREEMSDRLIDLHDALEVVDKDGSADLSEGRRMREALDATFRWIRMQGLSIEEPVQVVGEILGVQTAKKIEAEFDILPPFAPTHERKKKTWKPKLTLPMDRLTAMKTIGAHRKHARNMEQVIDRLGSTMPPPSR